MHDHRRLPLRHVSPGFGFQSVLVRKDLFDSGEIRSAADMRGRKIALNGRGATPEVLLDAYLRTGGLTFADADVLAIPFAEMVAALTTGSIDVALPIHHASIVITRL